MSKEIKAMNTDIVEGNKLIAEFDKDFYCYPNYGFSNNETGIVWHSADELQYHTSWDWLRPAWDKFKELEVSSNLQSIFDTHRQSVAYAFAWYEISVAHDRIVRAITWYNQNKQS